jgi:site-specific DNA-methyltransferase (adenine-specific)
VHDGSDEVMAGFPESDGCQPHRINSRNNKYEGWGSITNKHGETVGYDGVGSAARFFYCAKASRGEREKGLKGILPCVNCGQLDSDTHIDEKRKKEVKCIRNPHPTVKPISLMRWLCSLVCPPNGIILDPFVGSGTTGIAAILENFKFLGIDKDEGYVKIAEVRIALAEKGMSYE